MCLKLGPIDKFKMLTTSLIYFLSVLALHAVVFAGSQAGWLGHWADGQQASALFQHCYRSEFRENHISVRSVFVHSIEMTLLTCLWEVREVQ